MNNCAEANKGNLLSGLASGMAIFLNATGTLKCNDFGPAKQSRSGLRSTGSDCYGTWDWQWCTEMTQPFSQVCISSRWRKVDVRISDVRHLV